MQGVVSRDILGLTFAHDYTVDSFFVPQGSSQLIALRFALPVLVNLLFAV
jgi:hypothetical protein